MKSGPVASHTDVPSIVAAYEKRIRDLEERKIVLAERIANCGRALPDFDSALKTPLDFLVTFGVAPEGSNFKLF